MLNKIIQDAEKVPSTIAYKIDMGTATLDDQEEACKDPYYAYVFAKYIKGADIEKCKEVACKNRRYAYMFARDVKDANKDYCMRFANVD